MRIELWLIPFLLTALLTAVLTACTLPPRPAAPIGKRVLIPTLEPATAVNTQDAITQDAVAQPPAEQDAVALAPSPLTPEQETLLASLPSRGLAPELDNEIWFNTEPLRLVDLRGKVVMVEFWTYG